MEQDRQRPPLPLGGTSYYHEDDTMTEPDNVSPASEHINRLPNTSDSFSDNGQKATYAAARKALPLTTSTTITPIPLPPLTVQRHEKRHGPFSAWWWEVAACVAAVASLLAIVATLRSYQDRPLPQLPFSISINALVSIYSVIMKASIATVLAAGLGQLAWAWFESDRPLHDLVAFDSASRDTFGALFLIWHVNFHHIVVLLGAVLTVVALAMDPFTQQLMQYVACNDTVSNQVYTIPRTNVYQSSGAHIGAGFATIPPDIQTSVNTGVFAGALPIGVSCPTGNCTAKEEYGSLAYCSSCQDISDQIQFTAYCSNQTFPGNTTKCPDGTTPDLTASIPGGLSMNRIRDTSAIPLMRSGRITDEPKIQFLMNKGLLSGRRLDPFTSRPFEGCDDPVTNSTWRCKQYGAAECWLSPCVRIYTSEVRLGVLDERQIDEMPSDVLWSAEVSYNLTSVFAQSVLDLACVNLEERSNIIAEGYNVSDNQRWLPYNVTFNPYISYLDNASIGYPQSLLAHKCLYIFDRMLTDNLWRFYLNLFFNATIDGVIGSSTLSYVRGPQMLQNIYNYAETDFARVDGIFQNISQSMTNTIRQTGEAGNSVPAEGDVIHYATCLRVEWGWIAFPTTLVAITSIFCALVIVTTATHRSEIWKSNPLAMVYHGPFNSNKNGNNSNNVHSGQPMSDQSNFDDDDDDGNDDNDNDNDQVRSIAEMNAAAKTLIVRLDRQDGKLKMAESQIRKRRIKA